MITAQVLTFKITDIELEGDRCLEDQIVTVERADLRSYRAQMLGIPVDASDLDAWEMTAMHHISEVVCPELFGRELDVVDCRIEIVG